MKTNLNSENLALRNTPEYNKSTVNHPSLEKILIMESRINKNNLYTYSEQVSHNGPKHLNYDKIVSKNKNNDIHMQNNLLEIY